MSDESLIADKKPDGFKSESPIRAFTDFKVNGLYAIGKGFRPALAHLGSYLDAMHQKEGWELVQVIMPEHDAADPTILFRKSLPTVMPDYLHLPAMDADMAERFKASLDRYDRLTPIFPNQPIYLKRDLGLRFPSPFGPDSVLATETPTFADPINPKHYAGRECADIGERLSANGFQILKYNWRLGKKDDPCVEIDKSIWYCESEIVLLKSMGGKAVFEPKLVGIENVKEWFEERIEGQSLHTQNLARMLWIGYGVRHAQAILEMLKEHRFHLECGNGLAV